MVDFLESLDPKSPLSLVESSFAGSRREINPEKAMERHHNSAHQSRD
jgi:hypothetical protein